MLVLLLTGTRQIKEKEQKKLFKTGFLLKQDIYIETKKEIILMI